MLWDAVVIITLDFQLKEPVFESFGNFFHPVLPQFTRLYK